MPNAIWSVLVALVLGAAPVAAQLPPDILVDSHLLLAEQSVREQDYVGARAAMEQMLALQAEHGLVPEAASHFRYAHVWAAVGAWPQALEAVVRYLELAGREGAHYVEALQLMNTANAAIADIEAERQARAAQAARERAERERALSGALRVITDMEFVRIPAGTFRMGCVSGRGCARILQPVHSVTVGTFALSKYEVTQSEWRMVMGENPSYFSGCDRCPVEQVSWDVVQRFLDLLNVAASERGRYRLPTEAEWEYAARAGTTTAYSWGNEIGDNLANCDGCGSQWDDERTAPVGSFGANAWGLHDMHGNVWEWVQDCWNSSYRGAPTDGSAWESGDCGRRVRRGGAWDRPQMDTSRFSVIDLRAANRDTVPSSYPYSNGGGFRVARTLTP